MARWRRCAPSAAPQSSARSASSTAAMVRACSLSLMNVPPGDFRIAFHETSQLLVAERIFGRPRMGAGRKIAAGTHTGAARELGGQGRVVATGRGASRAGRERRCRPQRRRLRGAESDRGAARRAERSDRLRRIRAREAVRVLNRDVAMHLLDDRRILITGVLSNRSIAYGVAKACHREGATLAFTYVNDELKDRVVRIAAEFGPCPVLACDVASDEQIARCSIRCAAEWGGLDGLLHSIAFAPREALSGDFLDGLSRVGVRDRARRLELQLRGAGQGGAAAARRPQRIAADAHVPRRRARARQLQRDGTGEGEPRGERALSRGRARAGRHARECDLRRADQDARRGRHRRASRRSCISSRRPRRCVAT